MPGKFSLRRSYRRYIPSGRNRNLRAGRHRPRVREWRFFARGGQFFPLIKTARPRAAKAPLKRQIKSYAVLVRAHAREILSIRESSIALSVATGIATSMAVIIKAKERRRFRPARLSSLSFSRR